MFFNNIKCNLYCKFKFYNTYICVITAIFFFTYLFFITSHLFGNHDYYILFNKIPWYGHSYDARPLSDVAIQLTEGSYIAIITPFISFIFFILSAILFIFSLEEECDKKRFLLSVLIFVLYPTLLGRIYYEGAGIGNNFGLLCTISGFYLYNVLVNKKFKFIIPIILFTIGLLVCEISINTIFCMIIFYIFLNKKYKILDMLSFIVIPSLAYFIIIKFFGLYGTGYNNTLPSTYIILNNIVNCFKAHLNILYKTQPPMDKNFKIVFCAIILYFTFLNTINIRKNILIFIKKVFLIFILLFFHNISAYASANIVAYPSNFRIDYYAVPLIYSFITYNILTKKELNKLINILKTFVIIYAIFLCSVSDCRAIYIWKNSICNDMLYCNRILNIIESNENFNPLKNYKIIQIGDRPVWSNKYYNNYDMYTLELQRPFNVGNNAAQMFMFISPNYNFTNCDLNDIDLKKYYLYIKKLNQYPKYNSIFIIDDYIFILLNKDILKEKIKNFK